MRAIPGTITDPNMDALLPKSSREILEAIPTAPELPEVALFNDYQQAAQETAMYPRVYTEHQVANMLVRAYMRSDRSVTVELAEEWTQYDLDHNETPFNRLVYPILGLVGEAGELANKLKKVARDDQGQMDMDKSVEIQAELGDVLWYVSAVATETNVPLERVAYANVRKLYSRKERGVLGGDGDNR